MQTKLYLRSASATMAILLLAGMSLAANAQVRSNSSSADNSLYGSVSTGGATATTIPLTLDDAIRRGLQHNLEVTLAAQDRRTAAGIRLQAINTLMPTVTYSAVRSRLQFNLAAEGFRANAFAAFPKGFIPTSALTNFPAVVTANVVQAQANLTQTLFDLRSFELYRAAKQEIQAVEYSYRSAQGDVIQGVAGSYLLAVADASNVVDAQGLLATNAEILRQATLKHEAGVSAKLDEMRARVQYQQQEQVLIARQNQLEKDKITLKREIGLPADQAIRLTDESPYADLTVMPLDQALQTAYTHRQVYLRLQSKLRSAQYQSRAARFERLPTLSFNGNYGVTGTVGGLYHGTFLAQGTLTVPIFREAKFRGDRDVADAATKQIRSQLAGLKNQIDAELRDSMLDIAAAQQLVQVARSNVNLSQSSLSDATDRFKNGVADDLPVVQAQATLATAQAQLVNSLYQYNQAKLGLARNLGVLDAQFRNYLGSSTATGTMSRRPVTASALGREGGLAIGTLAFAR